MYNIKRTTEQARENLSDSMRILDSILGPEVEKECVEAPMVHGHLAELNIDVEVIQGTSAIILSRLKALRGIISIQDIEASTR